MLDEQSVARAADFVRQARALVITAGAGMGVDSGLPDFRGDQGFWNAYPMYERLGINFIGAANPVHFARDPAFGWGFYGHRTNLYRETVPHAGFSLLQKWTTRFDQDLFIVTSNVGGQFQKAGFSDDQILEVHGSIHHLQCLSPCHDDIWDNREQIEVDFATMRADHVPQCPSCGGTSRPNILMFGDYSWLANRTHGQEMRFDLFLAQHRNEPLTVLEMGAGTAIPTIRHMSETIGSRFNAQVARINPREAQIRAPHVGLSCGALDGLSAIDNLLDS